MGKCWFTPLPPRKFWALHMPVGFIKIEGIKLIIKLWFSVALFNTLRPLGPRELLAIMLLVSDIDRDVMRQLLSYLYLTATGAERHLSKNTILSN